MANHSILIIEDEQDLRETFKDIFELSGFSVATANNGLEGLKQISTMRVPCLILLDLMMPVMNGWQFLEALKRDHLTLLGTVPVVVISAAADLTDVQRLHGCEIMKKPADIDKLIARAKESCLSC